MKQARLGLALRWDGTMQVIVDGCRWKEDVGNIRAKGVMSSDR